MGSKTTVNLYVLLNEFIIHYFISVVVVSPLALKQLVVGAILAVPLVAEICKDYRLTISSMTLTVTVLKSKLM